MSIQLKRVYEAPHRSDGVRILVERLWPRGLSKQAAQIDLWSKDTAPSHDLRRWFDHDPHKWGEFQARYFAELDQVPDAVDILRNKIQQSTVTLVFASKETECNSAVALRKYLLRP